ncbi:protein disulfide isomerase [Saccharomycopsis crataegensis]|uniref:Protein disulfide isomerase n=1 Tax=Saccharomycopsis crataegensis TaxID=43959 RepID=A0AAV5QE73_9ASCO|nr:protein disulfide isomerase [Saccharomycopsis crataegensis]
MLFLRLYQLLISVALLGSVSASVVSNELDAASDKRAEAAEENYDDVELPPSLTQDDFDPKLTEGLHMVEFYSPYCVHCTQLMPIWKKVYKTYGEEAKKLGIDIHQVNCVEQGDICDRESVKYYPNIRIYGPNPGRPGGKVLSSFPSNIKKTEENLKSFIKESAYQFGELDKLNLPSQSNLIDTGSLAEILAGKSQTNKPILLSFWPSSDDKFTDIDADQNVFDNCEVCREFRTMWNIISNQLVDDIETGHVNCESSGIICQELGYKELLQNGRNRNRNPRVAVVLPRSTGNFIKYSGPVNIGEVVTWTKRFLQNYKVEDINPYELSQKMNLVNRLINEPKTELPGESDNKVSFIYYYGNNVGDESLATNPTTAEDFEVLPYLLDPVMKLPDIYLYKSNDTGFLKLIERQTKNMLRYIHYNVSEPVKEFDRELFVSNTVTSLPTIIGFKDNCLIPYVFQNFDPKDIRNPKLVEAFIRRNSLPFISELTPGSFKKIFNLKNNNIDKVVVAFFDSGDPGFNHGALNNLMLAAHDYHYYWSEHVFKQLAKRRQAKADKVAKLRAKGADSVSITSAMANEIDYDNAGQVVFTYLDLNKFKDLISEKGWNIHGKEHFDRGDAIIIERTGKFYYEHDSYGNPLRCEPWAIRNTLMSFHDKNYVVRPLKKNLINSPYGNYLRPMDYIHRHGIRGYLLVIIVVVGCIGVSRKYNITGRRSALTKLNAVKQYFYQGYSKLSGGSGHYASGANKSLGILGNIPGQGSGKTD